VGLWLGSITKVFGCHGTGVSGVYYDRVISKILMAILGNDTDKRRTGEVIIRG